MIRISYRKRMQSAFLALCTVFSLCVYALPVYAVDSINAEEITSEEIITENAVVGEKSVLNAEDVPELIDFQTAKDKGHVLRLRQKESDDHTVIFLNDDNTETMYIFAEPIKYTDSDGNVKDKKRTLTLENDKYTMAENDVQVSFPTGVNDGISISKGDVNITMIPVADTQTNDSISATATAELVNNRVSYSNVFGTADLQYTPLYSGFKEDIILESYTGVSEFNFIVYTNGLTPVKNENGSVSFIDPETNSAVAEMMQVVCYDAEQDFASGDVRITTVKENGIYGFTVIANVNFLTDEDTLYPVSVDPTITLTGTTAIEDAVVYSGKQNSNFGSYHYNSVGYVDDSYKIGRLFVRFPTLEDDNKFQFLRESNGISRINSATFTLYTSSRGSGTVKVYQHFGNWAESTIKWSSVIYADTPILIDTVQLPTSSLAATEIDLTQTVKSWLSNGDFTTPECGITLINSDESDPDVRRSLLSTEYADANNTAVMPTLVINYDSLAEIVVTKKPTQLYVGEEFTCSAEYRVDGVTYAIHNGTSFTFVSSDTDVVTSSYDISGELYHYTYYGVLKGKKPGKANITVSYAGLSETFEVQVVNQTIRNDSSYIIDNDKTNNFCDVNAYIIQNGKKVYDSEAGIEYSIYDYGGLSSSQVSVESGTGVVRTAISSDHDPLLTHPLGTITVLAETPYVSLQIEVDIICGTPLSRTEGNGDIGVFPMGGRYIRIIFDEPNENIGFNNSSELQNVLTSRGLGSVESFIDISFKKNDGQFIYEHDIDNYTEYHKPLPELIRNSTICCLATHGEPGGLALNQNESVPILTVDDILQYHNGFFGRCQLVLLTACSSAADDTENSTISMAQAFVDRGAKSAVGFSQPVSIETAEKFEYTFLSHLRSDYAYYWEEPLPVLCEENPNNSIYDAVLEAQQHHGSVYAQVLGDKYHILDADYDYWEDFE